MPSSGGEVRPPRNREALIALYAAERAAGGAVQSSILVIWIGATTYLTTAFGVIALMTKQELDVQYVYYLLPIPACALAGYHLILFGIGVVRSGSIELLEEHLVASALGLESKYGLQRRRIGSVAETDWTTWGSKNVSMTVAGVVAFLVPYVSAVVLVIVCLCKVEDKNSWFFPFAILVYLVVGVYIARLGARTVGRLESSKDGEFNAQPDDTWW